MQEKNYKLCSRATRSRRLGRDWPGCLVAGNLRDSRKLLGNVFCDDIKMRRYGYFTERSVFGDAIGERI